MESARMSQNKRGVRKELCWDRARKEMQSAQNGKYQKWKVSEMESVRNGKCQKWKVSEMESVRNGKCQKWKV